MKRAAFAATVYGCAVGLSVVEPDDLVAGFAEELRHSPSEGSGAARDHDAFHAPYDAMFMGSVPPDRPADDDRSDAGSSDDLPPDPFAGQDLPVDLPTEPVADPAVAGPFGAMFGSMFGDMLNDVRRQMAAQGPFAWDAARHSAIFAATDGQSEANVDPVERVRLEELVRIAEPYIADATGLAMLDTSIVALTRAQWAARFLEDHRSLFERLAVALQGPPPTAPETDGDPTEAMVAGLLRMIGPGLLGMQAGTLAGHLAKRCLGSYDLPLPRISDDLVVVPDNIASFASDWTLPIESVRMRLVLVELTHHGVLAIPHVRAALGDRLAAYADSYRVDPEALADRFGSFDPSDPRGMEQLFSDPMAMLGVVTTPVQHQLRVEIDALVAAVIGYVDHIVARTSERLIGGVGQLGEAMRRRRIEAGGVDRSAERLLGLALEPRLFERGTAFVAGVLERAGDDGLARLWSSAANLPTPTEIDAPGLWLARIDLA